MADRAISELTEASSVTDSDSFVLQQSGSAKQLTGRTLVNWLLRRLDGHGGITEISAPRRAGLRDTYTISMADGSTFDFTVDNGVGIASVEKASSGLRDTYTMKYNNGESFAFSVNNARSITGIAKQSTSGLNITYRISFNDGTHTDFTVTNGAKGDKGDNSYVHIKYASQEPTAASHSIGDVPDAWIGIMSDNNVNASTDWTKYKWYQIKGAKGDKGDNSTVTGFVTEYQVGSSGTVRPSGAWSTAVPSVAQGKYLWTRTTIHFNSGSPIVSYSVSRQGIDGSGSVSAVNGRAPDADGNITLNAEDVGARAADWVPTAAEVGARPSSWMPTAADVGARPSNWMPTAAQVGARPSNWMPTAAQVGARPSNWMPTAADVGALTKTLVNAAILPANWNTDTKKATVATYIWPTDCDIIVSPSVRYIGYSTYVECGVRCISHTTDSITFECDTIPKTAIAVEILVLK